MKKIKKILVEQLKVGMYVSDLDDGYMDHPFTLSRFQVKDDGVIRKLIDASAFHIGVFSGYSFLQFIGF